MHFKRKNNNLLLLLLLTLKYSPILIVALFLSTMTTVQSQSNLTETIGVDDDTMPQSTNELANNLIEPLLKFTSKLCGANLDNNNVILSPISIHKALNMVLLGADHSTQTEQELINVLGYNGLSSKNDIIKYHEEYSQIVAKFKQITRDSLEVYKNRKQDADGPQNRHGPKPPILDLFNMVITKNRGQVHANYSNKIKQYYDSSIVQLDDKKPEVKGALLERLDKWSKEAEFKKPIMTSGELEKEFAAILLSAVRVQAFWFQGYFDESTEKDIFHQHGLANQTVDGKWLSRTDPDDSKYLELTTPDKAQYKRLHARLASSPLGGQFNELTSLNCQVIEVPLEGNLSFTIIEPLNVSGLGGELNKLANLLFSSVGSPSSSSNNTTNTTTRLSKVLSLLDSKHSGSVNGLGFPKFSFESEINLKPVLQSLGLRRAFDSAQAEISNMTLNKVFIEEIKHQAVIDVNKIGIKAAGVTTIRFALLSAIIYEEPIFISVRNPFIFMLRYQRIPLFIGQLTKLI